MSGQCPQWGRLLLDRTSARERAFRCMDRKLSVPVDDVRRLHDAGSRPSDIAEHLGIGRASVYRALVNKLPVAMIS